MATIKGIAKCNYELGKKQKNRGLLVILNKFHRLPAANKPSSASCNNLNRVPTNPANIKLPNISQRFTSNQLLSLIIF
jgi:hypothetical protein